MSADVTPKDLIRSSARGAVPTLVFMASLAFVYAFETASLVILFGGLIAYAVLTASAVTWATHPCTAFVAAVLPACLVAAGVVVGSWAVLPVFWCLLAAAAGLHLALRFFDRRPLLSLVMPFIGFASGMAVGAVMVRSGTLATGLASIAMLAALLFIRLKLGDPQAERSS